MLIGPVNMQLWAEINGRNCGKESHSNCFRSEAASISSRHTKLLAGCGPIIKKARDYRVAAGLFGVVMNRGG